KENVLKRLPKENQSSKARRWFYQHPLMTAAALFLIFMTGYLFSLWEGPQQVSVVGKGHVKQGDHMVIVPKGEVIQGNLIVHNSDVKIEGKVHGDVTVINGRKYLASAGQVTGHVRVVDAVLEWIWYQIKHLFTGLIGSYKITGPGL
ncbi:MAG TPA: anti-sigma factor, partial [Bacillales bacterium]|nr:anti-sigma factor [Bacillales bacterium]